MDSRLTTFQTSISWGSRDSPPAPRKRRSSELYHQLSWLGGTWECTTKCAEPVHGIVLTCRQPSSVFRSQLRWFGIVNQRFPGVEIAGLTTLGGEGTLLPWLPCFEGKISTVKGIDTRAPWQRGVMVTLPRNWILKRERCAQPQIVKFFGTVAILHDRKTTLLTTLPAANFPMASRYNR
jgi:hypothetical protein